MVNDTDAGLRLLSLRTQRGSPFLTYVAIKEHRTKEGEAEHGPALFISGLPLNFDADAVAEVFACFGEVLQVVLHGNKVRQSEWHACMHACWCLSRRYSTLALTLK